MKQATAIPSNDAQLLADAEALYEALSQLVHVYQYRDRVRIYCHDVSVTHCHAMEALAKQGAMRLQVLAEHLLLDKSTASRVVDSLVKKGYVARVENPVDRRAVMLNLTTEGSAVHLRIRTELIQEECKLLADLPLELRSGAPELLRRLTAAAARRTSSACEVVTQCADVDQRCC